MSSCLRRSARNPRAVLFTLTHGQSTRIIIIMSGRQPFLSPPSSLMVRGPTCMFSYQIKLQVETWAPGQELKSARAQKTLDLDATPTPPVTLRPSSPLPATPSRRLLYKLLMHHVEGCILVSSWPGVCVMRVTRGWKLMDPSVSDPVANAHIQISWFCILCVETQHHHCALNNKECYAQHPL